MLETVGVERPRPGCIPSRRSRQIPRRFSTRGSEHAALLVPGLAERKGGLHPVACSVELREAPVAHDAVYGDGQLVVAEHGASFAELYVGRDHCALLLAGVCHHLVRQPGALYVRRHVPQLVQYEQVGLSDIRQLSLRPATAIGLHQVHDQLRDREEPRGLPLAHRRHPYGDGGGGPCYAPRGRGIRSPGPHRRTRGARRLVGRLHRPDDGLPPRRGRLIPHQPDLRAEPVLVEGVHVLAELVGGARA